MGEPWAELCSGSALFVFNGVDIVFGVALTVYSLYIGVNHYAPEWLFGWFSRNRKLSKFSRFMKILTLFFSSNGSTGPILAVGVVLVLTGFMSWCGSANMSCSLCLSISSYLLIVLALAELALGIAILTQGEAIDRFLREHQQELHLTYLKSS